MEAELRDAVKRQARFEEWEVVWKTLKGNHEDCIRQLEKELDAAKEAPALASSKAAGHRGKGAASKDADVAELEKLLDDSELARAALAQQLEDTGPVPQGFTDMARDLYDHVNKALQHGRLGSLPEPVERTSRLYLYALRPIAELVEGVSARTRSVMELEGR